MSLSFQSPSSLSTASAAFSPQRQLSARVLGCLALLLTLAAVAADQFIAPVLYSSSPLWATAMCLVLVWRNRVPKLRTESASQALIFSLPRVAAFITAHLLLVLAAIRLGRLFGPFAGAVSSPGWTLAFLKLLVLAPTVFLVPLSHWRMLLRNYRAEFVAALIVLFTFFPNRILDAAWPWYGQVLGRTCFVLARIFVPSLTYSASLTPTLNGPQLDLTILRSCSGVSGIELFDYLAAFVAVLDWNRLRKCRVAFAYFGGVLAILLGNAFRLTSFAVLGNHGFGDFVAHFHVSAGWILFSLVFLLYLGAIYRFLLQPPESSSS